MKKLCFMFCINTIFFLIALITGCRTIHPTRPIPTIEMQMVLEKAIDDDIKIARKQKALQNRQVQSALLPPLKSYLMPVKNYQNRFDVSANKIPAKEFFTSLVSGTSANMLVHPEVKGEISMYLKNVTITQVLEATRDLYGYDYRRTTYGYEVLPFKLTTQIFHINYLNVQRKGQSTTQVNSGQISNKIGTISTGSNANGNNSNNAYSITQETAASSSVETKSEVQFWQELEKSIFAMIGKEEGRQVSVNAQAGIVMIKAFPNELKLAGRYLERIQSSLERQVIIEAKILEVQLNDNFQSGIDWGIMSGANPNNSVANMINPAGEEALNGGIGQLGNQTFPGTDITRFNGMFTVRFKGSFAAFINLLQSQGNVQVLSSPHIATVNNQKAVIKVGQDEFFVTGVSTSNTIIGTNTLPSQDVSLTPFFSGIILDVTPEISQNNNIILHIHPSVSKVTEQSKTIKLGQTGATQNNLELPLAISTIRESDNIVRVKNNQVIVIGGLMENNMRETIAATPALGKLPFLGALFRNTHQASTKTELIILLKPKVVESDTWLDELAYQKERVWDNSRPFHQGGLSRVFGNEAEKDKTF